MSSTKIIAGVLFLALATTTARAAHESSTRAAHGTSALVVRTNVGISLGETHGDASFLVGGDWRVALAWSSAHGRTRAGVVIAAVAD